MALRAMAPTAAAPMAAAPTATAPTATAPTATAQAGVCRVLAVPSSVGSGRSPRPTKQKAGRRCCRLVALAASLSMSARCVWPSAARTARCRCIRFAVLQRAPGVRSQGWRGTRRVMAIGMMQAVTMARSSSTTGGELSASQWRRGAGLPIAPLGPSAALPSPPLPTAWLWATMEVALPSSAPAARCKRCGHFTVQAWPWWAACWPVAWAASRGAQVTSTFSPHQKWRCHRRHLSRPAMRAATRAARAVLLQ